MGQGLRSWRTVRLARGIFHVACMSTYITIIMKTITVAFIQQILITQAPYDIGDTREVGSLPSGSSQSSKAGRQINIHHSTEMLRWGT